MKSVSAFSHASSPDVSASSAGSSPGAVHATLTLRAAHASRRMRVTSASSRSKRAASSGSSRRTSSLARNSAARYAHLRWISVSCVTTSLTADSAPRHAVTSASKCAR